MEDDEDSIIGNGGYYWPLNDGTTTTDFRIHPVLVANARMFEGSVNFLGVVFQDKEDKILGFLQQRGSSYPTVVDEAAQPAYPEWRARTVDALVGVQEVENTASETVGLPDDDGVVLLGM